MLTNINEIEDDYAFLKKVRCMDKKFREKQRGNVAKDESEPSRTNFIMHPKLLSSDSDCSSDNMPSIRKLGRDNESNDNISLAKTFSKSSPRDLKMGSSILINEKREYKTKNSVTFSNLTVTSNNTVKKGHGNRSRPSSVRFDNLDKKYNNLIEKNIKLLNEIRYMLQKGIPPPDGEEDHFRRTKRLQEFSSRFSRNYLYQLQRQMNDLTSGEKLPQSVLNQKLSLSYQVILQALQAYHHHLPTSIHNCCSDKLQSLLEQCLLLNQIHGDVKKAPLSDTDEFINAMKNHTELLLDTVTEFNEQLMRQTIVNVEKKKVVKTPKAKSKLSMYNSPTFFRRDPEYRKAFEAFSKKKFNVKSRYKTASFKHRPPVEKPHIMALPSKTKLFPKRSSGVIKSTPRNYKCVIEDDIETLVEHEIELQVPDNSTAVLIQNDENVVCLAPPPIIGTEQQLVQEQHADDDKKEEIREDDVREALNVLQKCLGSTQMLANLKANVEVEEKRENVQEVDDKKEEDTVRKKYKEPKVTVTGAKNAKLICIRDDNSLIEEQQSVENQEIMSADEKKTKRQEKQTKQKAASKSNIKISRLPQGNRKVLELLPKNYAINVIQYKLMYHNFHKENTLYRKSTHILPWVLMGRISDDVLNDLLEQVVVELEANPMLENLYNAEFQY